MVVQEGGRDEVQKRRLWNEYVELQQWKDMKNELQMEGMWEMKKTGDCSAAVVRIWIVNKFQHSFHVIKVGNKVEDILEIMTPLSE